MSDCQGAEVLVVDDTPANLKLMRDALAPAGYEISVATSGAAALKIASFSCPDLILLDVQMPDMDGYETCRQLKAAAETRNIPVVFITARDAREGALEGFRAGGVDFISKPVEEEEVLARVRTHLEINYLRREVEKKNADLEQHNDKLRRKNEALEAEITRRKLAEEARARADEQLDRIAREEAAHWGIEGFIGRSHTMAQIFDETRQLQEADVSGVLIAGESGTGKELIARALHSGSARKAAPFVAVNCAAVPMELAESAFFGHIKGAFTGASEDRKGYFELADHGTLFLDELGEMPLELQAKLLRVLEDGVIQPVGSGKERSVDVRVLAATNADLSARIVEGSFRQDLYYRLARFRVEIPPLRQRREDIPLLVEHFLQRFAEEMNLARPELTAEALQALGEYDFPGNIRELKNMVEHALIKSRGAAIEPGHLFFAEVPSPSVLSVAQFVPPIDDEQRILAYVKQHGKVDNETVRRLLDANHNRAKYLLEKLCRTGKLRREGQSRSTCYVAVN